MRLITTSICLLCWIIGHTQHQIHYQKVDNYQISSPICHGHTGGPKYKILRPAKSRNTPENPLVFNVDYDEKMPSLAVRAFKYATDILSSELSSTVPVNVKINWGGEDAALASAGTTQFLTINEEFTTYPIALAEKIIGFSVNEAEPDIIVNVNRGFRWFYNYDTPDLLQEAEYDFVTVMLHELIHGLGFIGHASVSEGNRYGYMRIDLEKWEYDPNGIPAIFDLYKANLAGENICQNIEDQTIEMGNALSGNSIYLKSPKYTAETAPRLYGPTTYAGGSSFSHLNSFTYERTKDALMTPFRNSGTIVHDLGVSLDMLEDIGWRTTHLFHQPNTMEAEVEDNPLVIDALVTSDLGYEANTVTLHYSQDTFKTMTSVVMNPTDKENTYSFTLPEPTRPTQYQYYFSLVDSRNLTLPFPKLSPDPFFYERAYEGLSTANDNILLAQDLKIYPTPITTDFVTVEANFKKEVEALRFTVYDVLGRSLTTKTVAKKTRYVKEKIELIDFSKGIYILQISVDENTSISRKIIVE